ncbi:CHASE domain-containing protein [Marinobacter segnicrescens]|uniref:Sensor domain CHASE1-containing protein n=1 Tax=Marinobacter segnicrescens TaxID=430453 RepID=A0A1I0EMX1_9GAMM|nr:CHASE domain-containing protein [Marinobacter segnicrescens]SET46817.1 sensor domain CHASE1-containing protein [Marinobacter segnicrescens]
MDPQSTSGRPAYLWWLLPVLVLAGGLLLTTLIAPRSQAPVQALTQDLSRAHHDQLSRALVERAADVLIAARSITSPGTAASTDTDAFKRQAVSLLGEFPEVAGVELLTLVSHDQRAMVERQLSEQAGQFIRFARWTGTRDTEPAEPADRYLVIRQGVFQPETGPGVSGLGLVATSVPHWRDALRRARRENRPTATTVTELQRNGGEQRALRVFIPFQDEGKPEEDRHLLALVIRPDHWLERQLDGLHDTRWQVEVHDISQHARQPLATLPSATPPATDTPATRSTLTLANRQWMLSTRPADAWLGSLRQQALWPAWLVGLAVTLLAASLTAWACWQLMAHKRLLYRRTRRARRLGQQLDNTRVEKNILHHSLQESDRRARDLIELGGGIFAELDEGRHIGYLSPQAAILLDIPSTELIGTPLDALFAEEGKRDLAMTFDAARRDQGIERLDTEMVTQDGRSLAITLRVKALKDPLSGCAGFRVSLTPRQ